MKVIKFTKNHSPYVEGEVASFSDEDADVRIQAGVAELVKEYKVQPDIKRDEAYDDQGTPMGVRQARMVPQDLERNVDLPPTEAGGKPKAEENLSDEEKERVAKYEKSGVDPDSAEGAAAAEGKAQDAPKVNKMADRPAAKK